jgi:putative membrane protein insertion efficiency factor
MNNSTITSEKPLSEPTPSKPSSAAALIALVRCYQRLRAGRVAPCRFYPSCSTYALEALETHGALRGTWLAVRRVLRCRPFGPHGIDLVPEPRHSRSTDSCTR